MTKKELVALVNNLEFKLYSYKFQGEIGIAGKSNAEKEKFIALQHEITSLRIHLATRDLEIIADELKELSPALETGTKEMEKELEEMKDFIRIIDTVSNVIGLVGKVVKLAIA